MPKPRGPVEPGQHATTPYGAPFPLRSWPPDAAIDIQNLATWSDTQLTKPVAWNNAIPGGTNAAGAWNRITVPSITGQQGGTFTLSGGKLVLPYAGWWQFLLGTTISVGASNVLCGFGIGIGSNTQPDQSDGRTMTASAGSVSFLTTISLKLTASQLVFPMLFTSAALGFSAITFKAELTSR